MEDCTKYTKNLKAYLSYEAVGDLIATIYVKIVLAAFRILIRYYY